MSSVDRSEGPRAGEPRARRPRIRAGLLVAVALLYLLSVPWYRDAEAPLRLVLGLPDWVTVALGCYVAAAVLNALAWLATDIDDARDTSGWLAAAPKPDPEDPAPPA